MEQDGQSSAEIESDRNVIERVRRGDVQAYGALVERYERGVLAAVLPISHGDLHAAQDVVQDVFVQCYTKLPTLRDESRFGHWLMKIARREAVRAARRWRKRTLSEPVEDVAAADSGRALDDEDSRWLLDCVRRLPEHEQLVVSMHYFDGHGVAEIARLTGRPVGTITKQLSRAIERLRGQMKAEIEPCRANNSSTSRSAIA